MVSDMPKILVVDDEPLWLELIGRFLTDLNFRIVNASSGPEALDILKSDPQGFELVILDKVMVGMDGIEVLRRIKSDPVLKILPVILESADAAPEKILEGIRAGAYFYLTKPFSAEQMRAVVNNALNQHRASKLARRELRQIQDSLNLVEDISLGFRTPEQAKTIAALLSNICSLSMAQEIGLLELMLNAVEHGNLGIGYNLKTVLVAEGRLEQEITRRLALSEYADKIATVKFRRCGFSQIFNISDQGAGFNWRPFLDMQIERINDNHGRGITLANKLAFTNLSYRGSGNSLEATIILHDASSPH